MNGRGCVTRDPALLARMAARGATPDLAIGVDVEEAYLHCAKAFKRSGRWEPARWPDRHAKPAGMDAEAMARLLDASYRTRLY